MMPWEQVSPGAWKNTHPLDPEPYPPPDLRPWIERAEEMRKKHKEEERLRKEREDNLRAAGKRREKADPPGPAWAERINENFLTAGEQMRYSFESVRWDGGRKEERARDAEEALRREESSTFIVYGTHPMYGGRYVIEARQQGHVYRAEGETFNDALDVLMTMGWDPDDPQPPEGGQYARGDFISP